MTKTFLKTCIFNLFDKNVPNLIQKEDMAKTKSSLVFDMLNYDNLTQKTYQNFIQKLICYVSSLFELKEVFFEYDESIPNSDAYSDTFEKVAYFGKYLFFKPVKAEYFFEVVNTIIHELAHLEEVKTTNFDYKKFDNENGTSYKLSTSESLNWLCSLFIPRQNNQIDHYSYSSYTQYPWEIYARKKTIQVFDDFLCNAKQLFKDKKNNFSKNNFSTLQTMTKMSNKFHKYEVIEKKKANIYLKQKNYACKVTRACFDNLIQSLSNCQQKISFEVMDNILTILEDKSISTQSHVNKFFSTLLKQSLILDDSELAFETLKRVMSLISSPSNLNSKTQLKELYNFSYKLEQRKYPNILSELQYYFTHLPEDEKPFFTIPEKYLINEYKNYHSHQHFQKYMQGRACKPDDTLFEVITIEEMENL